MSSSGRAGLVYVNWGRKTLSLWAAPFPGLRSLVYTKGGGELIRSVSASSSLCARPWMKVAVPSPASGTSLLRWTINHVSVNWSNSFSPQAAFIRVFYHSAASEMRALLRMTLATSRLLSREQDVLSIVLKSQLTLKSLCETFTKHHSLTLFNMQIIKMFGVRLLIKI